MAGSQRNIYVYYISRERISEAGFYSKLCKVIYIQIKHHDRKKIPLQNRDKMPSPLNKPTHSHLCTHIERCIQTTHSWYRNQNYLHTTQRVFTQCQFHHLSKSSKRQKTQAVSQFRGQILRRQSTAVQLVSSIFKDPPNMADKWVLPFLQRRIQWGVHFWSNLPQDSLHVGGGNMISLLAAELQ